MTFVSRRDYAFPLRIDNASSQTSQAAYVAHVEQMVRQLLLTSPGERINLPTFGCGLRQLVFAPITPALDATLKLRVMQGFQTWLSGVAELVEVAVASSEDGGIPEPGTVQITVTYTVVETQSSQQLAVTLV